MKSLFRVSYFLEELLARLVMFCFSSVDKPQNASDFKSAATGRLCLPSALNDTADLP